MKIVGIMPVHNEAWCLGLTLRSLANWCDEIVVMLHNCSDDSERIAYEVKDETGRVVLLHETDPTWHEMPMRQRLLEEARKREATHVAILDADELLTSNLLSEIRGICGRLEPATVLELPGFNLRGGIDQYHANGIWSNRWFAAAFGDYASLGWYGDQFHHRHPMGRVMLRKLPGNAGIMHLWGASERRLKAKHALYKITERLRWPEKSVSGIDRMYSLAIDGQPGTNSRMGGWGTPANWDYAPVPETWWAGYGDMMQHLDLSAVPTQEAECLALIERYGAEMFNGLNLFGVVEQCQQASAVLA